MRIGGRRGGSENERSATTWKEFRPLEDLDVDFVFFFMAIRQSPYFHYCTTLLDTRIRFNFCSHYHSSYPMNKLCMHVCMAHFVTQRSPKCLLWSNEPLEYTVITLYYGVVIRQYVHILYMAQGYNVS